MASVTHLRYPDIINAFRLQRAWSFFEANTICVDHSEVANSLYYLGSLITAVGGFEVAISRIAKDWTAFANL